jgi:hypothetical protein
LRGQYESLHAMSEFMRDYAPEDSQVIEAERSARCRVEPRMLISALYCAYACVYACNHRTMAACVYACVYACNHRTMAACATRKDCSTIAVPWNRYVRMLRSRSASALLSAEGVQRTEPPSMGDERYQEKQQSNTNKF